MQLFDMLNQNISTLFCFSVSCRCAKCLNKGHQKKLINVSSDNSDKNINWHKTEKPEKNVMLLERNLESNTLTEQNVDNRRISTK